MGLRLCILYWVLATVVATTPAWGQREPVGHKPGYLEEVESDRHATPIEIPLPNPLPPSEKRLSDVIFDSKLKKEFTDQYQAKFGQTTTEQSISLTHSVDVDSPSRFDLVEADQGLLVSPQEGTAARRKFGEYMLRRLAEHHVDRYAKSSPTVRPIYEAKERFTNLNLEFRPKYKVKFHYAYSGNYFSTDLENPYNVIANYTFYMNPDSALPNGQIVESQVTLGYPLSKMSDVSCQYKMKDGVISLVGRRRLSPSLETNLTYSANTHNHGTTDRESRILAGFIWAL